MRFGNYKKVDILYVMRYTVSLACHLHNVKYAVFNRMMAFGRFTWKMLLSITQLEFCTCNFNPKSKTEISTECHLGSTYVSSPMAATSSIYFALVSPGVCSSMLVMDIGIAAVVLWLFKCYVLPVITLYKRSTHIDELVGPLKRHWLYGHTLEVRQNFTTNLPITSSDIFSQDFDAEAQAGNIVKSEPGNNPKSIYQFI